ncbi:MAG: glycosyltransferase family 9 protein [Verrucomicrobiota bacterium]
MGRFLFIRGGAVGDFILTMPAIQLVREGLPDNEIEVLGYPAITELALRSGLVDQTRSIEDARLAQFFAPGAKLDEEWCRYFASFNVVVSYLYDPDEFFANNLKKAGVKTLLTGPFRPLEADPPIPAAVQLAKPLERFALYLDTPSLVIDPSRFDSPELPEPGPGPRIAIHPGSGSASKNWSFEAWVEVLGAIHEKHESSEFLVTSGEAERELIDDFLTLLNERGLPFHHLSEATLPQLAAAFSTADYYLGHDSGVSHLAALAKVPGLILFGPSHEPTWKPMGSHLRTVLAPQGNLGFLKPAKVLEEIELFTRS